MRGYIEGDLFEVYDRRVASLGKRKADLLFVRDVLMLFRPGIIRPFQIHSPVNHNGMMNSYIRTGWRNLWRHKLYSTLNVTGLTFGIVCFLLIGLYVYDELTFDTQHQNAARIYRVVEHRNVSGETTVIAAAGYKLAEEAKRVIPEVENVTRMMRSGRLNLVDPEHPVPVQETVTFADENFFQLFDFPLLLGDTRTALKEPSSIVISEALARRLFNNTDVLGKMLDFSYTETPFKITGVMKDHPANSSFNFTSVISESSYYGDDEFKEVMASDWSSDAFSVYVLLRPGSDPVDASRKMTALVQNNAKLEPGTTLAYQLQPLNDVHLHSENIVDGARNTNVESIPQGNPLYVAIFSFAAVFVLLIAGINYTNLTTARASSRLKEIGVRKSVGAIRSHLMGQFLVESMQTTFIALLLALIVASLLLPSFNNFADKQLSLWTSMSLRFWLCAMGLILFVGFVSGSYAALLLSRFKPVALLKGLHTEQRGTLSVRKGLVIFQFALSTLMIIGTLVLIMQVRYLTHTELGFNKDLMVVIDVNVGKARTNFDVLKTEMSRIPTVKDVSVTSRVPGEWKTFHRLKVRNAGSTEDLRVAYFFGADPAFLQTYDVKLLMGRNFNTAHDSSSVIINETAAKMLKIEEPVGQQVDIAAVARDGVFEKRGQDAPPYSPRVIGIVKDFHFQSLRDKIEPLMLGYHLNPIQSIDYYSVRIASADMQHTLDQLKAIMVRNDPREPFEYHFLDDQLALFYQEDARRETLLTWVAGAAIFIACLGLFGLATYATERRVKEIGVRKVLGAGSFSLVSLLSLDFVKLVLIANVIAFPVGWWITNRWLEEYAYHIEVRWWVYVLAGIIATAIALVTISYQAIKTATSDPVKSLRSE
jgi:putative ABC transport system permease protein